MNNYLCDCI